MAQDREKLETELRKICDEGLALMDDLIGKTNSFENTAFYIKMKGDYARDGNI